MTAGGKRPGAGRPPLPAEEQAVAITMRVHPLIAAKFVNWCERKDISQAKAFSAWVRRLK